MFIRNIRQLPVACLLLFHAACTGDSATQADSTQTARESLTASRTVTQATVAAAYALNTHQAYVDSTVAARQLDRAIQAFVADPTPGSLRAARRAWVASRVPYRQTEVYRFYDGPIDDPADDREVRLNAWPLDEAYIDSVQGNPNAGIINDPVNFPTIDRDTLLAANFVGSDANVATGYHAIEFLLWGQDHSVDGPGNRSSTDFVDGRGGTLRHAARRRAYLSVASKLLVEDLQHVADRWDPKTGDYPPVFLADARTALTLAGTGTFQLASDELSGERMLAAYESQDQEDEHSCFSDTTRDDLFGNALGIQNVYLGQWGRHDGPGFDDLVKAINPELDARMKQELSDTLAALQAIPQPFDQAIIGDDSKPSRVAVLTAIRMVQQLGETVIEVGDTIGLDTGLAATGPVK
jgi:putative iron-regulated protein